MNAKRGYVPEDERNFSPEAIHTMQTADIGKPGTRVWDPKEHMTEKAGKGSEQIDALLEKPFWVVDPLPHQVPVEGEGQFFAVEAFFLNSPMRSLLLQKHARILLKLNCYYDLWVAEGEKDQWIRNPDPAIIYRLAADERRFLNILLGEDILIVLSDFDMTVYNADSRMIELIRTLACAEGLFVWQPA